MFDDSPRQARRDDSDQDDTTPTVGPRRRWTILLVCSLTLFMTYMDNTILTVALPRMQVDLHASVAELQWVIDAYLLVLAGSLLLAGTTADRWGRRRLFLSGLVVFTIGSLLCGFAPSVGLLVATRILQALGGAMMTPSSLSIVRHVFTDPGERARALGVWSAVFGVATACGPLAGGLLVGASGWRSVFWVNVPIGVLAVLLGRRLVPESRAPRPRRADPAGQTLMIVFLAALTYAVIQGPAAGFTSPLILGGFAVAVVALAGFVGVEWRRREPMLQLRYFAVPAFRAATVIATLAFIALAGFLFVTTLYLQQARGFTPFDAGAATLPATVGIALCAPLSGRWVAHRGPRTPMIVSGICVAAGAAILLLTITASTPYLQLAVAYLLIGAGLGIVNPPITTTAVSSMPPDQTGVASAIASTARQIGNVMGVAVMGAMLNTATGRAHFAAPALASATRGPWMLAIALGLAIAATALTTPRTPGQSNLMSQVPGAEPSTRVRLVESPVSGDTCPRRCRMPGC